MTRHDRPRVLIVAGYFDWFSGYQETVLARAFSQVADTNVLAGNRVSPIFSDDHLAKVGASRIYPAGECYENDVLVTRLPIREIRSMVWSRRVPSLVQNGSYDLVVQVMPGQLFPALASIPRVKHRVALYGDNAAMYAALGPIQSRIKFAAFSATKGLIYWTVNRRASRAYGYTMDTITRLRHFAPSGMEVLPLAFDREEFYFSRETRSAARAELNYDDDDLVVIAAGKVQPQKCISSVVESIASYRQREPRVRLIIVGMDSGEESCRIRKHVEDSGISDITLSFPFVDARRLNELFNAADVGIWPTMPAITIQQAMGTGLQVIIPRNQFTDHLLRGSSSAHEIAPRPEGISIGIRTAQRMKSASDMPRCVHAKSNEAFSGRRVVERLLEDLSR
ncbi:glycosyltransferase [Leekyejoonella antrihumi]|uniref:Glycosyltransferase family 4 protein n=1 Tax=Leekyejoonella antrihumi TaxID=1660198 RepID=A0A563E0I8_9MICO|nr:glycosyltransferase [Leekyejoonella antrihumi]TWP35905.1 glycosyltransferase family 4 protein [Leekyejoonella antrihumi]